MQKKKLVLVGDSVFAQVAFEFFQEDSNYEVVAFTVERPFLGPPDIQGIPVVAFEDLETTHPPADHSAFVAIVFTQFNRLRTRLYHECKAKGYTMASYLSSAALVRPKSSIGEHCFICEQTVIQPFTEVGNNVVIWSGNQVCHRCHLGENSFILPNCIISDGVKIGKNCIIGANVTFGSDRSIGDDCYIGAATLIEQDVADGSVIERVPTDMAPVIPDRSLHG